MSDVALVIDTRAPKHPARRIGGGLDGPEVVVARPAKRRPTPPARIVRARDPEPEVDPEPEPAPAPPAPAAEATVTPPDYDPPPPPVVARAVLDEITGALAQLVPALPGARPLDLIRLLALKLDGHQDCAQLIHPRPGSLTLLDVRARCLDLIDCLPRPERLAVAGLIASDVGGAA